MPAFNQSVDKLDCPAGPKCNSFLTFTHQWSHLVEFCFIGLNKPECSRTAIDAHKRYPGVTLNSADTGFCFLLKRICSSHPSLTFPRNILSTNRWPNETFNFSLNTRYVHCCCEVDPINLSQLNDTTLTNEDATGLINQGEDNACISGQCGGLCLLLG